MAERPAGGHASIHQGELQLKTQSLRVALWRMKTNQRMGKTEFQSQVQFLDLLCFAGDWEGVIAEASQSILRSENTNWNARFYRFWIEGLKETHDVEGLQRLGKHLLSMRTLGASYQALACLCFVSCGRKKFGRVLYRDMVLGAWKSKKHWMVWEAMCAWLADSPEEKDRLKGVSLYLGLARRKPQNYLLCRGALESALDSDEWEGAAAVLNSLGKVFPLAPEHSLISARALLQSGSGATALEILEDYLSANPNNADATLLLSQALDGQDRTSEACELLASKSDLFEADDYDFNLIRGQLEKKRYEKTSDPELRNEAIRHLAFALRFSIRLRSQDGVLHALLHQLKAGVGEETFALATAEQSNTLGPKAKNQTKILFLSEGLVAGFFEKEGWFVPSPTGLQEGEVVFVATPHSTLTGVENIVGSFKVGSPAVPDRSFGSGVIAVGVKKLTKPVQVELHDVKSALCDKWGCENFARKGTARFFEIPSEIGSSIQAKAKSAA